MIDDTGSTAEDSIAVILVAGYLGAGKTTWVNSWLKQHASSDTLVLVNDFGDINIDAELIDYQQEKLLRLDNGCLCCSLSDALGAQLSRIARWPQPPGRLLIETSGVARPARVADMIRLSSRFDMHNIVTLIDLSALDRHRRDTRIAALVETQIAGAETLSINRSDTLTSAALTSLMAWLRQHNDRADIEMDAIAQHTPAAAPAPRRASGPIGRISQEPDWQRFRVTLPRTLSRSALENLLHRHTRVLARAKGMLYADGRHYVFHWSGGRASWTPAASRPGSGQLVGIGFAGAELEAMIDAIEGLA